MRLKLYLIILAVSILTIFLVNFFLLKSMIDMVVLILWSFLNPIVIIGLDGIIAAIIHHTFIPESCFYPENKLYQVQKKELSFYRKIKINAWKDFVPETGKQTTGMSKSKIEKTTSEYLYLFLIETCYAEIIHYFMAIIGFLPMIFAPRPILFSLAFTQGMVNFVLNIPPILIQRNNRPKLQHIYERQKKKDANLEG